MSRLVEISWLREIHLHHCWREPPIIVTRCPHSHDRRVVMETHLGAVRSFIHSTLINIAAEIIGAAVNPPANVRPSVRFIVLVLVLLLVRFIARCSECSLSSSWVLLRSAPTVPYPPLDYAARGNGE